MASDVPGPRSGADAAEITFEAYVAARGAWLVGLAARLLADPCQAEDVVQDVLARAYRHWPRIVRGGHPDAYLRAAVVNATTSFFRRAARRERTGADPALFDRPQPDGSDAHASRDLALRLLAGLPARQRAVLVLRLVEELPDAQIARLLGCSESTVRSQAHRGLATVRAAAGPGPREGAPLDPAHHAQGGDDD
ncbi:MAG: SigE family RNA polymerase sigma factor [Kineosporiaceae bacterium]